VISAGSYILSAAGLAALALSLGFSAVRLRQRLLPDWEGAPAHLVEAILAIAILLWLAELLGLFGLLYASTLLAASLLLAAAVFWRVDASGRGTKGGDPAETPGEGAPSAGGTEGGSRTTPPAGPPFPRDRTRGQALMALIAVGVVAVVFAHWGLTAKDALGRGIFNFDSLWYHMPFATEIAQSHSVTGLHYTETVFTNWLYPQNSELLHAVGILFSDRDTLSLFLNFGWLAIAFLAAWCIGRPYGKEALSVAAVAILLECHTLVVREPGAAKNDVMAAALILAAIAILINAWATQRARASASRGEEPVDVGEEPVEEAEAEDRLLPGWPLAAAGLATGLAAGTKWTTLGMAAALTVAVLALAPARKRWAATGWWFLPALAGGGFWYLRNLIVAGNPLPQLKELGPVSLPHPERLQTGRPDFSIVHYATDTTVWRDYFGPGLDQAFGALWPLVVGGAVAGGALALLRGGSRVVRWSGFAAVVGFLLYLVTPLSAAGAEGAPVGFAINIRYAIPALLAGAALLPLGIWAREKAIGGSPPPESRGSGSSQLARGSHPSPSSQPARTSQPSRGEWVLLAVLLAVMVLTNRADAVLRDPDRFFGLLIATLAVLVPAALLFVYRRGRTREATAGFALLAIAIVAIGYPLQRDYLRDRFGPGAGIPGMNLDSAYSWARDVSDARVGLAGTTAGFLQYGFYGTELSNRVRYLGEKGPHAAFNAIPDCRDFRSAVNAADLDYLVTSPFLNFIHPDKPIPSPEAGWLRGGRGVTLIDRSGPVAVWRLRAPLDPDTCGPANAPLRRIPQTPGS
jgi:hypothetical protein